MIHLDPEQIQPVAREMYNLYREMIEPEFQLGPLSVVAKSTWDELAIWHLRKTGEIKETTITLDEIAGYYKCKDITEGV